MKLYLAVIPVLALVAACGGASGGPKAEPTGIFSNCTPNEAQSVVDALSPIALEFSDAYDLASNTGRGALSGPIADMQQTRRTLTSLDTPPCGDDIKAALTTAYEGAIDGFLAFQSQDLEVSVAEEFEKATRSFETANELLTDLRADALLADD